MPKATIMSKSGAQITIEGSKEDVSSILSVFERSSGDTRKTAVPISVRKQKPSQRPAAADLVLSLKDKGFFEKPKGLGEISKALEEEGFLFPITTLSGVVLGLVQKKHLRRKKNGGKWIYGK